MADEQPVASALRNLPHEELLQLFLTELEVRDEFRRVLPEVRTLLDMSPRLPDLFADRPEGTPATGDDILSAARGEPSDAERMIGSLLTQLRISADARRAVLAEPMIDASAVAALLRSPSTNPRELASTLRRQGFLLGVPDGNRYLYPEFQFDGVERTLRPAAKEVNLALDALGGPWAAASWWVSPHGRLAEGVAPKDLLGTDREEDLRLLSAPVSAG